MRRRRERGEVGEGPARRTWVFRPIAVMVAMRTRLMPAPTFLPLPTLVPVVLGVLVRMGTRVMMVVVMRALTLGGVALVTNPLLGENDAFRRV